MRVGLRWYEKSGAARVISRGAEILSATRGARNQAGPVSGLASRLLSQREVSQPMGDCPSIQRPGRAAPGLILLCAVGLTLAACAAPPPSEPRGPLRWPEPPQTVRIEFVRSIRGAADIARPPGLWQKVALLLGVSEPRATRPIAHPADVEISDDGTLLYVSDFAQGLVHVFDLEAGTTRYFGEHQPFVRPFGLALDAEGNLYVAEQELRRIRVVSPSGDLIRTIPCGNVLRPVDIELDESGERIFVVDGSRQFSPEHYVHVLSLEGEELARIGGGRGSAPGELLFPTYLALDESGRVFVTDTMNSRISVFGPDGEFERTIGDRGDGAGFFDKPKGLAFDAFGNLYVVDSSWSNVQIFGPHGDVLLYFGGRGGYAGLLRNPTGIAIARDAHEIVVGDYLNRRLSLYRLVNTTAGDGIPQP